MLGLAPYAFTAILSLIQPMRRLVVATARAVAVVYGLFDCGLRYLALYHPQSSTDAVVVAVLPFWWVPTVVVVAALTAATLWAVSRRTGRPASPERRLRRSAGARASAGAPHAQRPRSAETVLEQLERQRVADRELVERRAFDQVAAMEVDVAPVSQADVAVALSDEQPDNRAGCGRDGPLSLGTGGAAVGAALIWMTASEVLDHPSTIACRARETVLNRALPSA